MFSRSNLKFYLLFAAMGVVYFAITIVSFNKINGQFSDFSEKFTTAIGMEVSNSILTWINFQRERVSKQAKFLKNNPEILKNDDELLKYLQNSYFNDTIFDMFQIYTKNDDFIYTSDGKKHKINDKEIANKLWFWESSSSKNSTITTVSKHGVLGVKAINICVRVKENTVFCGVINAELILKKTKTYTNPNIQTLFLIDKFGNINTDSIEIDESVISNFLRLKEQHRDNFRVRDIRFFKIENLNWYVGVGINQSDIIKENFEVLVKNANLIFISFAILALVGNLIYTNKINRFKEKQRDLDIIIQNQIKSTETGHLVADISHQLKTPLNAISLVLSSTVLLKNEKRLSSDELDENLNLALKSVTLMSETIDTIKDFYRYSDDIKEFDIKESINNTLTILSTNLKSSNVNVDFICDEKIRVKNRKNYLQQVFLVLIQNSKDALLSRYKNAPKSRIIKIVVKELDEFVSIVVSDMGGGISKKLSQKIFSKIKVSSKKDGSGIGLYFAKNIAINKLGGDLKLINLRSPTSFELLIKKEMQYE